MCHFTTVFLHLFDRSAERDGQTQPIAIPVIDSVAFVRGALKSYLPKHLEITVVDIRLLYGLVVFGM